MQLKPVTGPSVEVSDLEILRAAGVIYQARRRVHAGPKRRTFLCRWCGEGFSGREGIDAHARAGCQESLGSQMGLMAQSDLLG
jgi:hypothetical protein